MHSYLGHHHSGILMIEAQFHLETIMMDWDMHWQHQLQKCSVLSSSCLPSSLPQVSPLGHCRPSPLDWLHESKAQFIFTYCTAAWVSNQLYQLSTSMAFHQTPQK